MVERKEQPTTVSIQLGTLFKPVWSTGELSPETRMVINPIEPEDALSSVHVEEVTDQGIPKWKSLTMGTTKPFYIGLIIDHVTKDAVIAGYMNDQPSLIKEVENLIEECAAKGKRQLNIGVVDLTLDE